MFRKLIKYRLITAFCVMALAFVIGGCIWAYVALKSTGSGPFILHFNDIEGITEVWGISTILFMGIFGVIAVLADLVIAIELAGHERKLGNTLAAGGLVFAILLFMAFAAILKVN